MIDHEKESLGFPTLKDAKFYCLIEEEKTNDE